MIEKIREKVILANNPECKTYEKFLEKNKFTIGSKILRQSRTFDGRCMHGYDFGYTDNIICKVLDCAETYIVLKDIHDIDSEPFTDDLSKEVDDFSILPHVYRFVDIECFDAEDNKIELKENECLSEWWTDEIIYSPVDVKYDLTLETLFATFNEIKYNYGVYRNDFLTSKNIAHLRIGKKPYDQVEWTLNKTLEDQSKETIKAIYDILYE